MADRPIFVPAPASPTLVEQISFSLNWHPGFAASQKKKNVVALHEAAARLGYAPLLEVSTKSETKVGQRLSAFNLKVDAGKFGVKSLEQAFQASKVFEHGGPYTDLYNVSEVRDAKNDPRLRTSGDLKEFRFQEHSFPLEPKTAFYDWLYISTLYPHREWLRERLSVYAGFTDIEFNPERSINCQARSCALLLTLMTNNLLDEAVSSPRSFIRVLENSGYRPKHTERRTARAFKVSAA